MGEYWYTEDGTYDERENTCCMCGCYTNETCDNCEEWLCNDCNTNADIGKRGAHTCD